MLSFTDAVKEAAVDCDLFKAHNMMGSKYRCFKLTMVLMQKIVLLKKLKLEKLKQSLEKEKIFLAIK